MRDHYDFSGGVRGKYSKQYAEATNVVVLDPDVAEVFRDRQSVNETLRAVGPDHRPAVTQGPPPNKALQPTAAAWRLG